MVVKILVIIILFWLNGIFYGYAAALQNISHKEVVSRALEGDKKSIWIQELLDNPYLYVNAIPVIVTLTGIWFGLYIMPFLILAAGFLVGRGAAVLIMLVLAVLLIPSLGVLTCRRVGKYKAEKFAYRYIDVVHYVSIILLPVTKLNTWLSRTTASLFGIDRNQTADVVNEEVIISVVDEAHEQGIIQENEAEMIQNIISFNETPASSVMTHRKQVIAFDEETLLSEVVDTMLEGSVSRYPVYRGTLDTIVGTIHYKEAVKFYTQNSWAKFKPLREIPGLIRNATFIPETRGIGDLFHLMQAQKVRMAVVVDEYGQTEGVVTMEDILEEIVGEILDEYEEEESRITIQKDNSVLIDALAPIDEVEEELGISFGDDCDFKTLNGVLTSLLGHIPTKNDLDKTFEIDGYRFTIVSLGNKTIGKVRAEAI